MRLRITTAPALSTPCIWRTDFAISRPIVLTSPMDGSPQCGLLKAPTRGHFDAAEWAPSTASKADICSAQRHVRFTPESGHVQCSSASPLWAKSGLMHCSKKVTHSITLSASRRTDPGIFKSIATGLAASLEGFSWSRIGPWRHGEDLEED